MNSRTIQTSLGTVVVQENRSSERSIVFLHGNSMNADGFRHQTAALKDEFHVVAVDFPGHGLSPAPKDRKHTYSFSGFETILKELHEKLALRDPVYVAQSLGGHILLEALPELFGTAGALLVGLAPFDQVSTLRKIFLPDPTGGALFQENLSEGECTILARAFVGPKASESVLEQVRSSIRQADGGFRSILAESLGTLKRRSEIEVAKSGKLPLAIVQGRHDRFINPNYFSEIGTETFWGEKVHFFSDSGHLPHLEEPQKFNMLLRNFLQTI